MLETEKHDCMGRKAIRERPGDFVTRRALGAWLDARWCATLALRPGTEWGRVADHHVVNPQAGMRRYDDLWRREAPTACIGMQERLDAAERCPGVARGRGRAT